MKDERRVSLEVEVSKTQRDEMKKVVLQTETEGTEMRQLQPHTHTSVASVYKSPHF